MVLVRARVRKGEEEKEAHCERTKGKLLVMKKEA
jgi:hypothetical protein